MPGLQVELLSELAPARRQAILSRSQVDVSAVLEVVAPILAALRLDGDAESLRQHQQFKADLTAADLVATPEEIEAAYRVLDPQVIAALKTAAANIEKFHRAQLDREMWAMEVQPGILAGRLSRPLDRVGCYIPGGLASYPSSALMNIIPAKVAGVAEIVAATPPGPEMAVNPATLVAAHLAGASRLFKIGGPWAIGSLAYGTQTVPRVDKIVGPGNKYVTAAKLLVFGQVDIDSPAGPSEALILADDTAERPVRGGGLSLPGGARPRGRRGPGDAGCGTGPGRGGNHHRGTAPPAPAGDHRGGPDQVLRGAPGRLVSG